jgi:hypothetical protein
VLATLPLSANTVVTVGRVGETRPAGHGSRGDPSRRIGKASAHLQRALELAGEADDPLAAAQARLGLAELALASGPLTARVVLAEQAPFLLPQPDLAV